MEQCIGDKALSVRPTFSFDSGSNASSSARSHSPQTVDDSYDAENDSVDFEDPGLKQRRQVKSKRKSHSSASVILGFLMEYGERREKVDEEKLNLMKTMPQDKKEFLVGC